MSGALFWPLLQWSDEIRAACIVMALGAMVAAIICAAFEDRKSRVGIKFFALSCLLFWLVTLVNAVTPTVGQIKALADYSRCYQVGVSL